MCILLYISFMCSALQLEFQDIFTEPEFYLVKGKIFGDALGNRAIRMAWNSVYTYVQVISTNS